MKYVDGIRNGDTLFAQGLRAPNPALLSQLPTRYANEKADGADHVSSARYRVPKTPAPKSLIIIRTKGKA